MTLRFSTGRWKEALLSERVAVGCFAAYLAVAYPLILFRFGRDEWFVHDDWNLIVEDIVPNVFTPVEQHWSTIPILIYRLYFRLFGANYFPFLVTVSALHVAVVVLLRSILRRTGATPWLSTLTAAILALFGPGYMAIVFSIEITQNLSIVLGLSQMILADHDGPLERRDWLGLLAGALSLMCSGLAPVLVAGVGIATLLRRGLRSALFHTVPLAAIFLAWFLSTQTLRGADFYRLPYSESRPHMYVWAGLVETISALGRFDAIAIGMFVVLLVGLSLRIVSSRGNFRRSSASMVLAILACAPMYFAVLGLQRSRSGWTYVMYSHHLYTGACFLLPALGYAANEIAGRWRMSAPALSGLLAIVIPFNVTAFGTSAGRNVFLTNSFTQGNRRFLLAVAHSPYASKAAHLNLERNVTNSWYTQDLRLGWVLEQGKTGRLPDPGPVDPDLDDEVRLFYALNDLGPPTGAQCESIEAPTVLHPKLADEIVLGGPALVSNLRRGQGSPTARMVLQSGPDSGHVIRVELPDMHLLLEPAPNETTFSYCAGPRLESPETRPNPLIGAIQQNSDAMDALRKAIQQNPSAMEALRKAMQQAGEQ